MVVKVENHEPNVEKKIYTTGRSDGATSAEMADYIMETINKL